MLHEAKALSWAYWRCGGRHLVLTLVGTLVLPTLFFAQLTSDGVHPTDGKEMLWMYLVLAMPLLAFTATSAAGEARRSFVLPVPAWQIIACEMLNGLAAVSLLYMAGTVAMNLSFGAGWPLLKPALALAGVFSVVFATCWALQIPNALRHGIVVLTASFLTFAIVWWVMDQRAAIGVYWSQWRAVETCVALLIVALSYCVAVANYASARRGRDWTFPRIRQALSAWWNARCAGPRVWSGRKSAEAWLEWRQKGIGFVYGTGFVGLVACFAAVTGSISLPVLTALLAIFTWILIFMAFLYGLFLGACGDRFEIRIFKATRPLSDRDLADGLLWNAARTVVTTWTLWYLVLLLVTASWWLRGEELPPALIQFGWRESFWSTCIHQLTCLVGLMLAGWCVVSNAVVMPLLRYRAFMVTLAALMLVPVAGPMLIQFSVPAHQGKAMVVYLIVVLTVLLLVATFIYGTSMRLGLIQSRRVVTLLLLSIVTFTVALGIGWSLRDPAQEAPGTVYLVLVVAAIYTWLPWASAPLAMWWNRHR